MASTATAQGELIGTGILNWNRNERVSDRYGSVHLSRSLDGEDYVQFKKGLDGQKGRMFAVVKETRQSRHIGDFFRGLYPETPEVGEKIDLGEGTVFFGEYSSIGLSPDDGRDSDWLNSKNLYRLHEQTVDLYFVPAVSG